ncbi:hypothetical protein HPP92_011696 [Vanilla planifolia]|uniref:Uncharacterized protein n=1 Tax=Vanilla planifolia TaxID=51239 RepID=A0A835RCV6_VANPL|nr:hypothetical protein HPP92_012026 [Vanilla planifolia]KAG0483612.1 hypothetical protein HPP92_011696 [Vanilla planifolia]
MSTEQQRTELDERAGQARLSPGGNWRQSLEAQEHLAEGKPIWRDTSVTVRQRCHDVDVHRFAQEESRRQTRKQQMTAGK